LEPPEQRSITRRMLCACMAALCHSSDCSLPRHCGGVSGSGRVDDGSGSDVAGTQATGEWELQPGVACAHGHHVLEVDGALQPSQAVRWKENAGQWMMAWIVGCRSRGSSLWTPQTAHRPISIPGGRMHGQARR